MLGIIVARERPEVEEERTQISGQINETSRNLEEGELKILEVLSTSKGNILEDENAIKNLSSSKVVMNELVEKEQMATVTLERITKSRQEYMKLTIYAVTLFFTGESMSSHNHMYQYSLSWFINLFCSSMESADKSEILKERLTLIREHFLHSLFANMVAGLFEEDKLIYSFLLACRLGSAHKEVFKRDIWKALMSSIEDSSETAPDRLKGPVWLPQKARWSLAVVADIPLMADSVQRLCSAEDGVWREMYEGEKPAGKHQYFTEFAPLQRLLFNLYFCKDKVRSFVARFVVICKWKIDQVDISAPQVVVSIQQFIGEGLGKEFVGEEPLDISRAFSESVAGTPLILILGEEVNPLQHIFKFGEEVGFSGKKVRLVTLGSGQEERASEVVRDCLQTSTWVVLANCHLGSSLMCYSFNLYFWRF